MFKGILKAEPSKKNGDTACYVDKDGKLSNQALHDEIMEGVDDTEIVRWAREQMKGTMTEAELDAIYPLPKK